MCDEKDHYATILYMNKSKLMTGFEKNDEPKSDNFIQSCNNWRKSETKWQMDLIHHLQILVLS